MFVEAVLARDNCSHVTAILALSLLKLRNLLVQGWSGWGSFLSMRQVSVSRPRTAALRSFYSLTAMRVVRLVMATVSCGPQGYRDAPLLAINLSAQSLRNFGSLSLQKGL